jgi:hypothetical protein
MAHADISLARVFHLLPVLRKWKISHAYAQRPWLMHLLFGTMEVYIWQMEKAKWDLGDDNKRHVRKSLSAIISAMPSLWIFCVHGSLEPMSFATRHLVIMNMGTVLEETFSIVAICKIYMKTVSRLDKFSGKTTREHGFAASWNL